MNRNVSEAEKGMKRFLYTDPLAAAWMVKHFGMRLVHYATEEHAQEYGCITGEEWEWSAACPMDGGPDVNMIEDALSFIEAASPAKIYLHSASLHLLEPILDDVIWTVEDGFYDVQRICDVHDKPRHNTWKLHKIIQRKGIAFMWPECEEA